MTNAAIKTVPALRRFVFLWIVFTIAAASVYVLVLIPLTAVLGLNEHSATLPPQPWAELEFIILGPAGFGGLIGIGQWLVLRKFIRGIGWWVVATLGGYTFLFTMPYVSRMLGEPGWMNGAALFASVGGGMGILQWLVLRGRVLQAGWWIVISLAGWLGALVLTTAAYASGFYVEPFDMLSAFLFPVIITGVGMSWLLRHSGPPVPSEPLHDGATTA